MAVVLLVFHYAVEFLYHLCRMLHYYGKSQLANPGLVRKAWRYLNSIDASHWSPRFHVWQVLFILARVATVIIAIVTLW